MTYQVHAEMSPNDWAMEEVKTLAQAHDLIVAARRHGWSCFIQLVRR